MIASNAFLLVQEKKKIEIELRNTTTGIEKKEIKKNTTKKKNTYESLKYQFAFNFKNSCATLLALQSWHGFFVEANMEYMKRFHSSHVLDV